MADCCGLQKDHAVKNDFWPSQLLLPLIGRVYFVSGVFENIFELSVSDLGSSDLFTERSQDFSK
jgi:hypothetical protein